MHVSGGFSSFQTRLIFCDPSKYLFPPQIRYSALDNTGSTGETPLEEPRGVDVCFQTQRHLSCKGTALRVASNFISDQQQYPRKIGTSPWQRAQRLVERRELGNGRWQSDWQLLVKREELLRLFFHISGTRFLFISQAIKHRCCDPLWAHTGNSRSTRATQIYTNTQQRSKRFTTALGPAVWHRMGR